MTREVDMQKALKGCAVKGAPRRKLMNMSDILMLRILVKFELEHQRHASLTELGRYAYAIRAGVNDGQIGNWSLHAMLYRLVEDGLVERRIPKGKRGRNGVPVWCASVTGYQIAKRLDYD